LIQLVLFIALFMQSSGPSVQSMTSRMQHGWFTGEVSARFNADGRTMTLLETLSFHEMPEGRDWVAAAGSVIDGASIPRAAWTVVGGPFEGRYRDASVIHDVACDERTRRWQDVHRVFYKAMLARGVGQAQAKIMYRAVYVGGPRWSPPGEVMGGGPGPTLTEEVLREDAATIFQRERSGQPMTLEEIESLP
jgi:hypothetical protein